MDLLESEKQDLLKKMDEVQQELSRQVEELKTKNELEVIINGKF